MMFRDTGLGGLTVVACEPISDERGSFARVFDAELWREHGLESAVVQCNLSRNEQRGILRGMHFQAEPYGEAKLVRCSRGAIFDVAVDLRRDSSTYCRWYGLELSENNGLMLAIPVGFAHGFLTLTDATELHYQISAPYSAVHVRGVRWNDPAFGIEWPFDPVVIAERDRTFPDFKA
jgi:dTDP-4-dehydrorhamnose 3,5-epimerase